MSSYHIAIPTLLRPLRISFLSFTFRLSHLWDLVIKWCVCCFHMVAKHTFRTYDRSRRKARLFTHPQIFFCSSMVVVSRYFSFTKNKHKSTSGGKNSSLNFQHWEIPSQVFNYSQKLMRVDPQDRGDHGGACLWHIPRKCEPQSPYIPAHWASTHMPPHFPRLRQRGGTRLEAGLTHQAPSSPAQPSLRKYKGEGE